MSLSEISDLEMVCTSVGSVKHRQARTQGGETCVSRNLYKIQQFKVRTRNEYNSILSPGDTTDMIVDWYLVYLF